MGCRSFICALLAVGVLAAPASSFAAADIEYGIQDDAIMYGGSPETSLSEWKSLGLKSIRLNVIWNKVAPTPKSGRQPSGFNPSDPYDPNYSWQKIDAAVAAARGYGFKLTMTITGPAPYWATQNRVSESTGFPGMRLTNRAREVYKPSATKFAKFATAVAQRYRNKIARYVIWNEPNFGAWLAPQWVCETTCKQYSPHLYRKIVRKAYPAIKHADPAAKVLIGALGPVAGKGRNSSPQGKSDSNVAPMTFMRTMGCRNSKFKRLKVSECKNFKAARTDDIALHPHSVSGSPHSASPEKNSATFSDIPQVIRTLDKLKRVGGLKRASGGKFDYYLTEFGYQTNPPETTAAVSVGNQSLWLQEAAYLAWKNSRVKNLTFYIWQDEPSDSKYSSNGWQSGLRFSDGSAKPALSFFASPICFDKGLLWGQVRAATTAQTVLIQRRPTGSNSWQDWGTVTTDANGFWSLNTGAESGYKYRFAYTDPGSVSQLSETSSRHYSDTAG